MEEGLLGFSSWKLTGGLDGQKRPVGFIYIWLLGLANKYKLQELMTDRFVQARNNYCKTWYTLDNFKILTILNLVETRDTDNDSFNQRLTLWSSEYTLQVRLHLLIVVSSSKPDEISQRLARSNVTTSSLSSPWVSFVLSLNHTK